MTILTAVIHPDTTHVIEKNPKRIRDREAYLQEALGLAEAINLDVVYSRTVVIKKINSATLIGAGLVDELIQIISDQKIKLLIINAMLTPLQQRNLERTLKCKVIDRTGLILDIFGARAVTKEGQLQVELASLSHQRSRLVRAWTHLERQRGGFGFIGGPGESQIELDRRRIDERILRIRKDLEKIRKTRSLHRQNRERNRVPVVAFVGYTNAGKSTLFNQLSSANVMAADMLFATLDPTSRKLKLPSGREAMISDTVGFIADLPTSLVEAFKATLEEILTANIIVHVRDSHHEDSEQQAADVEEILSELGIDMNANHESAPRILTVYNKIDLLDQSARENLFHKSKRCDDVVPISAETGEGLDLFLQRIDDFLRKFSQIYELTVLPHMGEFLAWCYRAGIILEENTNEETGELTLKVSMNSEQLDRVKSLYAGIGKMLLDIGQGDDDAHDQDS